MSNLEHDVPITPATIFHVVSVSKQFTATDSSLVLRTRWGTDRSVLPAHGDTFMGDYLLKFTRGRGGRIDGMLMSSGRVRGVRFDKAGNRQRATGSTRGYVPAAGCLLPVAWLQVDQPGGGRVFAAGKGGGVPSFQARASFSISSRFSCVRCGETLSRKTSGRLLTESQK